jgi:hypothetical protein
MTIELGEIDLPEGVLVILDPGLARFWRHDGDPASPRKADPEQCDLRIVGEDAEAAGRAYDRQFHPLFLYDITDPLKAQQHFEAFVREKGFRARAEVTPRVPHTERTRLALAVGKGLAVVEYNGLWAVAVSGLPHERALRVVAELMPKGEFAGRLRCIDVVVNERAEIVRTDRVAGVMVEHGQLLFAGLGPLGRFRMWESLDGLADLVIWGREASEVAAKHGASRFEDDQYGWKNLSLDAIGAKADAVQRHVEEAKLAVGVAYRPHCNLELLSAQMRKSENDAGQLTLDGARVVGCGNRWGDGIFDVLRCFDANDRLARVRVELDTEKRRSVMRRVWLRALYAVATRKIVDEREPIRFTERLEPHNENDSGWLFSSGTESQDYMDDPKNLVIVPLQRLLASDPQIDATLDAPVGARFRREDERFVPDDGG